ncbi:MAG: hypothetical protein ACR2NA_12980 [Solirubrobacterales bacterium]
MSVVFPVLAALLLFAIGYSALRRQVGSEAAPLSVTGPWLVAIVVIVLAMTLLGRVLGR